MTSRGSRLSVLVIVALTFALTDGDVNTQNFPFFRLPALLQPDQVQTRTSCFSHRAHHCRVTLYYVPTDPPDGSPSCSVEPVLNHSSLSLQCSWPGGLPAPSLHWTRGLLGLGQEVAGPGQEIDKPSNNITLPPAVARASNNTLFTCLGSHGVTNHRAYCSIRTCECHTARGPITSHPGDQ